MRAHALRVAALALGLALLCAACVGSAQKRVTLQMLAPGEGAQGTLQLEELEGGQRMALVELQEVPPPDALIPGADAYLVWLVQDAQAPVCAGALRYDRATRSGTLVSSVPSTPFRVLVTAQAHTETQRPSGGRVAERTVGHP